MIEIKCELHEQLQYKSSIKIIKIYVSASICSNVSYQLLKIIIPSNFESHCLLKDLLQVCAFSVYSYSSFGVPNRSALDFMFFQLKFPRSFLYYAEISPYYADIMLYAFQPLLCPHNRFKPNSSSIKISHQEITGRH